MKVEDPIRLKNRYYAHIKKKNLQHSLADEADEVFDYDKFEKLSETQAPSSPGQEEDNNSDNASSAGSEEQFDAKFIGLEIALSRFGEEYFGFNDQLNTRITDFNLI
mmetsp:Transcript_2714/g.2362  ORF Transcript_2714/g.2362 Transcript_2714/m.2362 type:complete len:107 (-) Transcript_2714:263-583(-)